MLKHTKILATVALSVLSHGAAQAETGREPVIYDEKFAAAVKTPAQTSIETKALAKDLQVNPFHYLGRTVKVQSKLMHEICQENSGACASVGRGFQFLNPEAFQDEQTKRKVAILNGIRDVVLNLSNAALACAPEDVSLESCAAMLEKAAFGLSSNVRFEQGTTNSSRWIVEPVGIAVSVEKTEEFLKLIEGSTDFLMKQIQSLPKVTKGFPAYNPVKNLTRDEICEPSVGANFFDSIYGMHLARVENGEVFLNSTSLGKVASQIVELNLGAKNVRQLTNAQFEYCSSEETSESRKAFDDKVTLVGASALVYNRNIAKQRSLLREAQTSLADGVQNLVAALVGIMGGNGNPGNFQSTISLFPEAQIPESREETATQEMPKK